jgi:hypothetical protein
MILQHNLPVRVSDLFFSRRLSAGVREQAFRRHCGERLTSRSVSTMPLYDASLMQMDL